MDIAEVAVRFSDQCPGRLKYPARQNLYPALTALSGPAKGRNRDPLPFQGNGQRLTGAGLQGSTIL